MASTRNLPHSFPLVFLASIAFLLNGSHLSAQEEKSPDKAVEQNAIDLNFKAYFASETAKLAESCLNDLSTLDEWKTRRVELRRQLFEMLGLDPLPEKTDLKPVITKTVEGDGFKVECLHFQSSPGLYVTGNLYIPNEVNEKLPAILYVCGHGGVKKDGISYGNKVHYQHHGAWFARNGYVCLTIDSLQLGEIEGIHHGTYKYDMWWWINRGYTPAGVEAWNCIRALDYLVTRPEVDMKKIGVTGRSGGGAYSWWIAALDERIKVAVPVAGITDLQNHVVDGCVEGHCDCMYFNNTYRWDYPMVAALVAPRPLLISNTDRDRIFPLDGVYRTYKKVRKVYELYEKPEDIALHITAGPHQDTQELRIHAFRWFNHHLKGTDEPIRMTADKFFEPEQLRVFSILPPEDSINAKVHETFVPEAATPEVPKTIEQWEAMRASFLKSMREKTFGGWPEKDCELNTKMIYEVELTGGLVAQEFEFDSQPGVRLSFYLIKQLKYAKKPEIEMFVDGNQWRTSGTNLRRERVGKKPSTEPERRWKRVQDHILTISFKPVFGDSKIFVYFQPRGYTETEGKEINQEQVSTHVRRRYALLGQTLDGMRVYDARRALAAARAVLGMPDVPVTVDGLPEFTGYIAMFEENASIKRIPTASQLQNKRPVIMNESKYLTKPMFAAILCDETRKSVSRHFHPSKDSAFWRYAKEINRLHERHVAPKVDD